MDMPSIVFISSHATFAIMAMKAGKPVYIEKPMAASYEDCARINRITMPAGLGIYWIATSVVTIIQQLIVNAYMDKVNIDDMIAKNLEKVNKKRAKQGLPPAKVTQNATASLKAIKAEEEKEKAAEEVKKEKIAKQIEESSKYYNTNAKPGSLASKAAMVQKYNEAHDKRK